MSFARLMASPVGSGIRVVAGLALITTGVVIDSTAGTCLPLSGVFRCLPGRRTCVSSHPPESALQWQGCPDEPALTRRSSMMGRLGHVTSSDRRGGGFAEALMVLRSRRDLPTDASVIPERAGRQLDPADVVLQHELAAVIQTAIGRLPDALRTALAGRI